jgi:hypothetical protein
LCGCLIALYWLYCHRPSELSTFLYDSTRAG